MSRYHIKLASSETKDFLQSVMVAMLLFHRLLCRGFNFACLDRVACREMWDVLTAAHDSHPGRSFRTPGLLDLLQTVYFIVGSVHFASI